MNYYNISLINSPLGSLTYHSDKNIANGTKISAKLNNRDIFGVVLSSVEKPEFETLEILEVLDQQYSKKQLELAGFISSYYICSLGDALGLMVPFNTGCTTLAIPQKQEQNQGEAKATHPQEILGSAALAAPDIASKSEAKATHPESKIVLSKNQADALTFLKKHPVSLLFGDTGSGKTEIYMKYFEDILSQSKRVIFLMPEISLTPQMQIRLEEHFGGDVVMYHSKLTPKNKKTALEKIQNGDAKIIAGPRSALFLPINDLGLIVVDEEHDDSYKSSSRPRYNARDLAIYMGKLYGVHVVLGSATPSLSTYVKFAHVRLKGGFFSSNREFLYERSAEALTLGVVNQLKKTMQEKKQAIVFIPTRANFKHLICNDCGHSYECVFCSVGLSVHNKSNALKCHYCNYTQAIPQRCCECGGQNLVSSRLGTAEAVKNLSEELKEATIEQFDRDVITSNTKLKKALKRFNDKESDILVGTQMLSKGHDYHGVTLAVVLGLDNLLNMPDYRSREKALSSLLQIAGRSGRKERATVLVQSFNEEFFKTYLDSYESFLEEEKIYREGLYPPYKKLARLLFAHKNGAKAKEAMQEVQEKLTWFKNIEIVGSGKCGIEKIANKYRFEILLRGDKSTDLIKAINASKNSLCEVDMDPIEFG